jgi:hypothetical protein
MLIQQREPSGSEAGEYPGWKQSSGNFADKASHSCCVMLLIVKAGGVSVCVCVCVCVATAKL